MNQNGITFYVLTPEQYGWLQGFCTDNDLTLPGFTRYEDGNYYLVSGGDNDFIMAWFDDDVNPNQQDYSTRFWTMSTVPSSLWP
jgi:hypothetical protein